MKFSPEEANMIKKDEKTCGKTSLSNKIPKQTYTGHRGNKLPINFILGNTITFPPKQEQILRKTREKGQACVIPKIQNIIRTEQGNTLSKQQMAQITFPVMNFEQSLANQGVHFLLDVLFHLIFRVVYYIKFVLYLQNINPLSLVTHALYLFHAPQIN